MLVPRRLWKAGFVVIVVIAVVCLGKGARLMVPEPAGPSPSGDPGNPVRHCS